MLQSWQELEQASAEGLGQGLVPESVLAEDPAEDPAPAEVQVQDLALVPALAEAVAVVLAEAVVLAQMAELPDSLPRET
jgi:hypothetical protein